MKSEDFILIFYKPMYPDLIYRGSKVTDVYKLIFSANDINSHIFTPLSFEIGKGQDN